MRYRPSYVGSQSGTESISRATIATAPAMALDSSGSCILRPFRVADHYRMATSTAGQADFVVPL
jgi:hypothetical protein